MEKRRERWLEYHDRATAGIPGLLLLVLDMPVRFTEAVDPKSRRMGVFKHARGVLRGRELPEAEAAREERRAGKRRATNRHAGNRRAKGQRAKESAC